MPEKRASESNHEAKTVKLPPKETESLRYTGALFYRHGWAHATSGNYSVRLGEQPLKILITASGKDKSSLGPADFVVVDDQGKALDSSLDQPSAETMLHVALEKNKNIGSVLHTHSVWGTLLSEVLAGEGGLELKGYEMLKGLAGISTHETSVRIEIFENTQDIAALAAKVAERLQDEQNPLRYGFLIRGHGLYVWGRHLAEARRHVEVLEFLFEVEGRRRSLMGSLK